MRLLLCQLDTSGHMLAYGPSSTYVQIRFLPGLKAGDLAASTKNPIIWSAA